MHAPRSDDLLARKYSGTIEYVSPEVLEPTECYGRSADFWSLGVMLYEMIEGLNPFIASLVENNFKAIDKKAQKVLMLKILQDDLPALE